MNYMSLIRNNNNYRNYEEDEQRQRIKQLLEQSYNKDTGFNSSVSSLGVNPYQWTLSHQQQYEPTVPRLDSNAFLTRLYGNRSENNFYDTVTKPRYQYASYESDTKPNIPLDSDFFTNKDIYDAEGLLKANNVKLPEKKSEKETSNKPNWFIRFMNKISLPDNIWGNIKYNFHDGDKNTGILDGIKDAWQGSMNNDDSKIKTGADFTKMYKKRLSEKGIDPDNAHILPTRLALKATKFINDMIYDDSDELKKQNEKAENVANFLGGLKEDIVYNPLTYFDLPISALMKGSKVQKGAEATKENLKGFMGAIEEVAPMMNKMGDVYDTTKEAEQIIDRVNDFNRVAKEGEGGVRWFGKTIIPEQSVRNFADKLPHRQVLDKFGEGYGKISNKSKVLTGLNDKAKSMSFNIRNKFTNAELIDLARKDPDTAARVILQQDFLKAQKNYTDLAKYNSEQNILSMLKEAKSKNIDLNKVHPDIEKIVNPVTEQIDEKEYAKIYDKVKSDLEGKLTDKKSVLEELKNIKDFKNPSYSALEQDIAQLNGTSKYLNRYGSDKILEDLYTNPTKQSIKEMKDYNSSKDFLKSLTGNNAEREAAITKQSVFDNINPNKNEVIKPLLELKNNKSKIPFDIDNNGQLNFLNNFKGKYEQLSIDDLMKQNKDPNVLRQLRNKELLDKSNKTANITPVDKQMIDTLWGTMEKKGISQKMFDLDENSKSFMKIIDENKTPYKFPNKYNKDLLTKDIEFIKKHYAEKGFDFSIQDLIGFDPMKGGKFNPHAIENIRNKSFELRYPTLSKWKTYIHDNLTGRSFGLSDVKPGKEMVGDFGNVYDKKINGIMSDVRNDMWKIQRTASNKKWTKEQLDNVFKEYSISKVREIERAMGETPEILEQMYYNSGKITSSANRDKAIRFLNKQGLDTEYEFDKKTSLMNALNSANKGSLKENDTWKNILKNSDKTSSTGKGDVLKKVINNDEIATDLTDKSKNVVDYIKKYHGVDLTDSLGKTIKKDWQLDNIVKYFNNPSSLSDKSYRFTKNIVDDAKQTNKAVNNIFDIIKDSPDKKITKSINSISNVLDTDNITRLTRKEQSEPLKLLNKFINEKDTLDKEIVNFMEREVKKYGYGSNKLINSIEGFLNKKKEIPNILSKIDNTVKPNVIDNIMPNNVTNNIIEADFINHSYKEPKLKQLGLEDVPIKSPKSKYDNPTAKLLENIAQNNNTISDLGKRDSNRINNLLSKLGIDTNEINNKTLGITKDNLSNFENVLKRETTVAPKSIGKTASKNITELLDKAGLSGNYSLENMNINRKNYNKWKSTLNEIAEGTDKIPVIDNHGVYMPKLVSNVEELDNPNAFLDIIKKDNPKAYDTIIKAQNELGEAKNPIITPSNAKEVVQARIENRKKYLNSIDKIINSPETKEDIRKVSREITGIENSIKDFNNYFDEVVKNDPAIVKTKKVYEQLSIDKKLESIPEEHRGIVKKFMEDMDKFGKEEMDAGILSKEQFESMANNYVPHVLHSEFKENYQKLSENTKNIVSGILENNTPSFAKSRKYIDGINDFNDYVSKLTNGEVKHFFETNLARVYLQRAYQHADALYDKNITEATLKIFGTQMEHFTSGENIRLGLKNLNNPLTRQQMEDVGNIIRKNPIPKEDYSEFYQRIKKENPGREVNDVLNELTTIIDKKELDTVINKIERNDFKNPVDRILTRMKFKNFSDSTGFKYDGIFKPTSLSPSEMKAERKFARNNLNNQFEFLSNKEAKEALQKIMNGKYSDNADKVLTNLKMKKFIDEQEFKAKNKYGLVSTSIKTEGKVGILKEDTYNKLKEIVDSNSSAFDSLPKTMQKGLINNPDELITHDTEMLRKIKSGEFVLVYPEGQESIKRVREISGENLAKNFGTQIKNNADKGIQYSGMVKVNPSDINFKTIMDKKVPVYAIPKEVHELVERTAKNQFIQDQNSLLNLLDKFQTLWKQNALLSVGFHTRNAIGNEFQNYLDLGARVLDPGLNNKALKVLSSKKIDDVITINNHKYTIGELRKLAQTNGVLGIENELREGARAFKKGSVENIEKSTKLINKLNPMDSNNFFLYKASNKAGGAIEGHARLVNFLAHLEDGKTASSAAALTNKFLFDYSDLTPFEKKFMKRAVPFYTWLRKNIPLQMEMLLNHQSPFKVAEKFRKSIDKPMDEKDKKFTPEFVNGWVNLGKTKEGKYRFMDLSLPYQDLTRITDPKDMLSGLSPLLKLPLEQWANKDLYFGTPIQERKSQLSKAPLAAKPFYKALGGDSDKNGNKYIPARTAHLMKGLMPSLNTLERMSSKVEKDPNMGIKAIMGAKYYDFDPKLTKSRDKKEYLQELYDIIKNEKQLGRYKKPKKEKKEKEEKSIVSKNKYLQLLFQKSKKR